MWLATLVRRRATRSPDAVALRDPRRELTWGELAAEVGSLAGRIDASVPRGGRIALMGENRVEMIEAYLAAALAGAAVTPVNPHLADDEIDYILDMLEPSMALGDARSLGRLATLRPELERLDLDDVPGLDAAPPPPRTDDSLDDTFAIMHTSATTGRPKGVVVSMRSLQANNLAWIAGMGPRDGLVYLHATPLFHGSMVAALGHLAGGASVAVLDRFTPQGFIAAVERWQVEHALLVPSMIRLVLETKRLNDADLSSLRLIIHTAEAMPPSLRATAAKRLGVPMRNSYGITEGGGNAITFGDEDAPEEPRVRGATCAGLPLPGYDARILREDGSAADPGEIGEMCLRGDALMSGYWRDEEATARALRDGWLHTGDMGYVDERGYLWVVDRRTDLIVRGGQNVYPAEVERVLRQSPNVADVAVVAVPSDNWGQTPWAFVQPTSTADFDEQELLALVVADLASYKRPSRFVRVESIPRSPSGKALRRILRDDARALIDRESQPAAESYSPPVQS